VLIIQASDPWPIEFFAFQRFEASDIERKERERVKEQKSNDERKERERVRKVSFILIRVTIPLSHASCPGGSYEDHQVT